MTGVVPVASTRMVYVSFTVEKTRRYARTAYGRVRARSGPRVPERGSGGRFGSPFGLRPG
ncbi:hypothetical protein GCM10007964_13300 [Sphaerisporangium melleum]|uniref:Uncharacterized protein n=1 Tax=Sphaerisporangium melleum TaxID=321316 RepID=A0A917QWC0_9ACTN|nr:hypothetical protein GCM10007964_13300 [Sphaerisporangium melleum]